ncbi:MAG TPA: PQQ-binding-like beta-propeller repeat protein [Solirubrobacteraceae bacterium]|nr:PQQ-binding-like beta-propeller repeat protein [Solirubrobacteraceae bacterium]
MRRQARLAAVMTVASLGCFGCGSSLAGSTAPKAGSPSAGPAKSRPTSRASGFGTNWTTYHGDAEATGVHAASTKLLPSRHAWTSPSLDGELYGEPLVADGRVIAATEHDTVYALAARSGRILWSRHLASPVPSDDLPCGDISPEVGITGTPVIDLQRNEIFVDADTLIRGPSASRGVEASHRLFGLNLFTGKVELDERAMPNAGEDQLAQLQRPGLALDHGFVVIAYGQNTGDCPGPNGPAHGYVVSIPERGGRLHYFQIGSGRDRGAVWMGGSSPVVDPHGNVYVASADGYDLGPRQPYDDSDAVLELSPTMHLKSLFYPRDWQRLSADDLDLGTGDPALVHGFVFQVGKTDIGYLLRQGHLGGEEGEVASRSVCSGDPDGGHAVQGSVVYIPCPNGVTAMRISRKAPYLKQLWTDNDGAAGGPIIADGLVWTIQGDNVYGLNPANGKEVVAIPFGGHANHFPTPSVGDGLLLLPGTDQVVALKGPAGLPPPPAAG